MSLHVGEAVGDYRVVGIIGAGGMGQVFQVEHKITKRKEAMKVLIADLADDTQVQRFKREIEVQARLNHPNIAAVHNAFRLKDRMVLVLEFVEGQTLESLLAQRRPPLETGIDYVRQTLEALHYAHHNGVIHRDVSPANLMITENGLVKLMDFGVAKSLGDLRLTDGGSMIGSLYYMSPEQVKGATDPDPRSDIYSAGAILYEIVTGKIFGLMLLGVIQIVFFLAVGRFLFQVNLGANLPAVTVVLLLFAWVAGSLGVLVGSVLTAEDRVTGICVLVSLLLAALGGCWWPLEIGPPVLKTIALCTPTGWALRALHQVISFGSGWGAVVEPILVLTGFGIFANFLAAKFFRS